ASDYSIVAHEVERFCSENGLPNSTGFKVRLVLEELVLNLIDHAVGSVTDRISVAVDLQPGRVVLVVEDDGAPFDPRSAQVFDKAKPFRRTRAAWYGNSSRAECDRKHDLRARWQPQSPTSRDHILSAAGVCVFSACYGQCQVQPKKPGRMAKQAV